MPPTPPSRRRTRARSPSGKRADLVVLGPTGSRARRRRSSTTPILLTLLEGRVVHRDPVVRDRPRKTRAASAGRASAAAAGRPPAWPASPRARSQRLPPRLRGLDVRRGLEEQRAGQGDEQPADDGRRPRHAEAARHAVGPRLVGARFGAGSRRPGTPAGTRTGSTGPESLNTIQKTLEALDDMAALPSSRTLLITPMMMKAMYGVLKRGWRRPSDRGQRALRRGRGGHAVHAQAPGHDVGDAGVEEADPEGSTSVSPAAPQRLAQRGQRVPGAGQQAQLGQGHGEQDARARPACTRRRSRGRRAGSRAARRAADRASPRPPSS